MARLSIAGMVREFSPHPIDRTGWFWSIPGVDGLPVASSIAFVRACTVKGLAMTELNMSPSRSQGVPEIPMIGV